MQKLMTVAASAVQSGDEIYNSGAYHPSAAWNRVTSVRRVHEHVVLVTACYETWKHPREGVAVRREVP